MSRGPTQEEVENVVNEFLLLQQQALCLATHTVNEHGTIVNINNNAGNNQMDHEEEDNANNWTLGLPDLQSQHNEEVQSIEEMDNKWEDWKNDVRFEELLDRIIENDSVLYGTKSKEKSKDGF